MFERLLEPFVLGGLKLKNHIVMPALSIGLASEDGCVTPRFLDYWEERARGGVGLMVAGYAAIDFPRGSGGPLYLVVDDDKYIPGLKAVAEVAHKYGAKTALQLNHAGGSAQESDTGVQPVAPSPVICHTDMPRELMVAEIHELVMRFAKGAERAKKAGFDGVEIHAATSYLIEEFLSPAYNRRTDEYGGDLKNRARFLLEIIGAVRDVVGPRYPVWARINGEEYGVPDGMAVEITKELARMLEEAGCCAVNVTFSEKVVPFAVMAEPAGSMLHLAEAIKKAVDIPVMITGRMTPEAGERALREKKTDLVVMGRALWADPELPNKVASGMLDDIRPCITCQMCGGHLWHGTPKQCAVNPVLGREREYKITTAGKRKRVLVIGGGPAGMEAARVAAMRGHEVTLYEKKNKLGGQLLWASRIPRRPVIEELVTCLGMQITKIGVKVMLGREVTASLINEVKPDVVIFATGRRYPLFMRLAEVVVDIVAIVRYRQIPSMSVLTKTMMLRSRARRQKLSAGDKTMPAVINYDHELFRNLKDEMTEIHFVGDRVEAGSIMEAIHDGARVGHAL